MVTPQEERLRMEYEKKFIAIDERIDTHDKQIVELQSDSRALKSQIDRLENTVTSEMRETRAVFLSTSDKQWDLIKSKLEMEYKMNEHKSKRRHELWLKAFGAGGILYVLFEIFTNLLLK